MSHAYIITKRIIVPQELSPEQITRLKNAVSQRLNRRTLLQLCGPPAAVTMMSQVFSEVDIRNIAVEIGDIIDTPDFQLYPNQNARTIDMVEDILTRVLGSLPR